MAQKIEIRSIFTAPLTCGCPRPRSAHHRGMVAGFISERWPTSNRNRGRLQFGTPGRIKSESASIAAPAASGWSDHRVVCQEAFSRSAFLHFLTFREAHASASLHSWNDSSLAGRAERSIPEARRGRAGRREGLTAKARAERQWAWRCMLRCQRYSCSPCQSITSVLDPRRSPYCYAALATSTYIRSG